MIKEFKRLKYNESYQEKIRKVDGAMAQEGMPLTKKIKKKLYDCITGKSTYEKERQKMFVYANEADVINAALFGMTAKEWKKQNPNLSGNIRDYTYILHLVVLSNLEVLNASMIDNNIPQKQRLEKLNHTAIKELEILINDKNIIEIQELDEETIN